MNDDDVLEQIDARIAKAKEIGRDRPGTRLPWVCTCPGSSAERRRSRDITAIAPKGECRFCGRNYRQANDEEIR